MLMTLVCAAGVCAACAQTLELPRTISQGSTLRIRGPASAVTARMNGRSIRLFPQADGGSFGLMPVPVDQQAGEFRVELPDGEGSCISTVSVRFVEARF